MDSLPFGRTPHVPSAGPALARPALGIERIFQVKSVSTFAMSLASTNGSNPHATKVIFAMSNWFQMIRVYAAVITAKVVDFESRRDGSAQHLIDETVSEDIATVAPVKAIAIGVSPATPLPAVSSLFDIAPYPDFRRNRLRAGHGLAPPFGRTMSPPAKVVCLAPTTTIANGIGAIRNATLGLHRSVRPFGAMPPVVQATRGISTTFHYTGVGA